MNKEEWKNLHEILNEIYSKFKVQYNIMRNGKNKQIRKEAGEDVESSIQLAIYWIRKYPEAFILLTGENSDGLHRAAIWDEFKSPNYFKYDMDKYLSSIEDKINTM